MTDRTDRSVSGVFEAQEHIRERLAHVHYGVFANPLDVVAAIRQYTDELTENQLVPIDQEGR